MTKRNISIYLIIVSVLTIHYVSAQTIQREVKRSSEKEVNVRLNASFGSVNVEKGGSKNIVEVYYRQKNKNKEPELDLNYSVRKDIGDLRIEMHPEGTVVNASGDNEVHVNANFKTEEWYVKLVEGIPLSIEAEIGAGKCNFDLSGLTINDLTISTGASSSEVRFNEKNKGEINNLQIETGVSKFVAVNLNNANYKKLSFDGGVGSYYLDFGGELNRTVDVNINIGLGALTLVIPQKVGVRIKYEDSWLSNFSIDDEFVRKRKGIYESGNFASADGQMNIFIESGLGSVKVRRSK